MWVKQYNFHPMDLQMMQTFADNQAIDNIGCEMRSGNTFYLRAVWGGADRPNAILGLVWQHSLTEKHCMIKKHTGLAPTDQLMQFD